MDGDRLRNGCLEGCLGCRRAIWNDPTAVSGHLYEVHPNCHIWQPVLGCSKDSKVWTNKVVLLVQPLHLEWPRTVALAIWTAEMSRPGVFLLLKRAFAIRMVASRHRVNGGQSIRMLLPALSRTTTFWTTAGAIQQGPSGGNQNRKSLDSLSPFPREPF